ncbi:MAG: sigma-70 family RNA polymerase sigma factor [Oscillospiraceae bacterium]
MECISNEILMHFRYTKKNVNNISINEPIDVDKDGNSLTLIDIMADDSNINDDVDLLIRSEQLYKFINMALNPREIEIITHRYGLFGNEPLTQREVAKRLNISRSYVSRIEKKALKTLREMYEKFPNC